MKKVGSFLLSVIALSSICGCRGTQEFASGPARLDTFEYTSLINNHLTILDFSDYLTQQGLELESVSPARPDVARAVDGAVFVFKDGSQLGVYRYDINLQRQRELLKQYYDDGFIYVLGYRYPVVIGGSFLVVGAEKFPQKRKLLEALHTFQ